MSTGARSGKRVQNLDASTAVPTWRSQIQRFRGAAAFLLTCPRSLTTKGAKDHEGRPADFGSFTFVFLGVLCGCAFHRPRKKDYSRKPGFTETRLRPLARRRA